MQRMVLPRAIRCLPRWQKYSQKRRTSSGLLQSLDADVFAALLEVSKDEVEAMVNIICNDINTMKTTVNGKALSVESRAGVIAFNCKRVPRLPITFMRRKWRWLTAKEASANPGRCLQAGQY